MSGKKVSCTRIKRKGKCLDYPTDCKWDDVQSKCLSKAKNSPKKKKTPQKPKSPKKAKSPKKNKRVSCGRRKEATCKSVPDHCTWDGVKCQKKQKPTTRNSPKPKTVRCARRKETSCKSVPDSCKWDGTKCQTIGKTTNRPKRVTCGRRKEKSCLQVPESCMWDGTKCQKKTFQKARSMSPVRIRNRPVESSPRTPVSQIRRPKVLRRFAPEDNNLDVDIDKVRRIPPRKSSKVNRKLFRKKYLIPVFDDVIENRRSPTFKNFAPVASTPPRRVALNRVSPTRRPTSQNRTFSLSPNRTFSASPPKNAKRVLPSFQNFVPIRRTPSPSGQRVNSPSYRQFSPSFQNYKPAPVYVSGPPPSRTPPKPVIPLISSYTPTPRRNQIDPKQLSRGKYYEDPNLEPRPVPTVVAKPPPKKKFF